MIGHLITQIPHILDLEAASKVHLWKQERMINNQEFYILCWDLALFLFSFHNKKPIISGKKRICVCVLERESVCVLERECVCVCVCV